MKYWFTADTHLGHTNILREDYDGRPFATIDEHDEAILDKHNSCVGKDDHVYHLGDVAFSKEKMEWWMKNANGHKHLIRGSHDDKIGWKAGGWATKQEALFLRAEGFELYLLHYACRVWRKSHYGSFHLFGHSHGRLSDKPWGRSMDVGVNVHNYAPVSLQEIADKLSQIQVQQYDEGRRVGREPSLGSTPRTGRA